MHGRFIQERLRATLDQLSQGNPPSVDPEELERICDEAAVQFRDGLKKQLTQEQRNFRLRMSNYGRPLCQLQREQAGVPSAPRDWNFSMRMMLGDAAEALLWALVRVSGLEITGAKEQAELVLGDRRIQGEDDIEIDHRVWDVKSSAPWTFEHKWKRGFDALAQDDGFGYLAQLYGYAQARGLKPGGWIVVNKSTGELLVVEAPDDQALIRQLFRAARDKLDALEDPEQGFVRCFEDFPETYRKKETGSRRLPTPCTFCDFLAHCWPKARYEPETESKAQTPRMYWYSHYAEEAADGEGEG